MMTAVSSDADGAIWSPDSHHLLLTTAVYPECSDKPKWADEDACNKAKDDAAAKNPVMRPALLPARLRWRNSRTLGSFACACFNYAAELSEDPSSMKISS